MLMAVDIGNTNIVIGFLEGDRIVGSYRITTKATHTSDEYGLMITQFLALSDYTADDVDDVIVCSVVPKVMYSFRASLIKFLGLEPMVVGPGVKTGMNIRLDDPKTLGSDCIADCAGAYHTYGGPVLVADFGTATTVTVVDADRRYRGGVILAGVKLSLHALFSGTAQLPDIALEAPGKVICSVTEDSLQAGAIYGAAAMADGLLDRMEEELGAPCTAVATGGLAGVITPYCRRDIRRDDSLLLRGLALIWRKNRGNR